MVSDLKELMNKVFPNPRNQFTDHNWLKTHAILAPENVVVNDLNFKFLEQLPVEHHIYNSINDVLNIDEAVNYPVEFLNSLTQPGLPLHNLHLKIGAPVMLLQNFDPPKTIFGLAEAATAEENIQPEMYYLSYYSDGIVIPNFGKQLTEVTTTKS
ncbi:ATP-dependent DNA helicase PIF1-like [Octopus vulgaris]|uniref:ATP-dependent DNA helicase PIF1-like n=1 Tax=Octopus vulgaris TaxID=6645 RepID=A0AA36BGA9_OCTVU|nr:ATP-dependent DNA helicase PIF1-like [Octopus vulgaris]